MVAIDILIFIQAFLLPRYGSENAYKILAWGCQVLCRKKSYAAVRTRGIRHRWSAEREVHRDAGWGLNFTCHPSVIGRHRSRFINGDDELLFCFKRYAANISEGVKEDDKFDETADVVM